MNCYEEKVITEVESIKETQYFKEFIHAFQNISNWAESLGNNEYDMYAKFEIELLCLYWSPIKRMGSQKKLKFNIFGDLDNNNLETLKEKSIKYFETRLTSTENYFLKYIYSDYLFENESESSLNKYSISIYLYDSLDELINYYQMKNDNQNDNQYVAYIGRFIEITLLMNNAEKLKHILDKMRPLLRENIFNLDYLVVPKLSENFRKILESRLSEVTSHDMKIEWVNILQSIRVDSFSKKDFDWHRKISEELIGYRRFDLISEEEVYDLNIEIGAGYKKQAEHQHGREQKSLIVKAVYLEKALAHYLKIGNTSKINEMKLLLRTVYGDWENSDEMHTIEHKISFPKEETDQTINQYIKKDNQESLKEISSFKLLFAREMVVDESEESSLLNFISQSVVDDGKKIANSSNDEERQRIELTIKNTLLINLHKEIYLVNIFNKLIDEHNLCTIDLMNHLDFWGYLDKKNRPFIEKGFERFFNKDYISSLHILVPQFESVFKSFFEQCGVPITSMKAGTTQQTQTFNAFLEREEIENAMDYSDLQVIRIIMVDDLGLNLRNDIAHGLIRVEDMTFSNCVLVIYLFLLLTTYGCNDSTADC